MDYDNVGSIADSTIITSQDSTTVTLKNNDDNRLVQITSNGEYLGDYFYDHLGQRVLKNDATTTIFIYDLMGNMIGEYDTSGGMIADYVYLGAHPPLSQAGSGRKRLRRTGRLAKIQASPGGIDFSGISG